MQVQIYHHMLDWILNVNRYLLTIGICGEDLFSLPKASLCISESPKEETPRQDFTGGLTSPKH